MLLPRPTSPPPEPGCCWFNFDDAQVRPIRTQDLEKQFSGKESAYMLFYRKRFMARPMEGNWLNADLHCTSVNGIVHF